MKMYDGFSTCPKHQFLGADFSCSISGRMIFVKYLLIELLVLCVTAGAQTHECGIVKKRGSTVTIIVDEIRPVDALANTLAQRFGIVVSAEEPEYQFVDDFEDVQTADPEWSAEHLKAHYKVPKRRKIEVQFSVSKSDTPEDVPALLKQAVQNANQQTRFGYRIDIDGEFYTLVPATTRNSKGVVVQTTPLLDRRISIPVAKRTIAEHAKLMAESLSAQTGLKVSCCQTLAPGRFWGTSVVEYGAIDETARKVLEQLIVLTQQSESVTSRNYWLVRCDSGYCFIDVKNVFGGACR
jgi:hypothetical protein